MPRRTATLIAAAVLLAALFPSSAAQASPYRSVKSRESAAPVVRELDPRQKFLASKLTPKAMRAAQPLDLEVKRSDLDAFRPSAYSRGPAVSVRAAAASAGDIPFTRTEIVNTTDAPNRTHGKIFMFEGSTPQYVCSGTVVNSAGKNVVWTAGHCIHEGSLDGPSGDFFDAYAFVPGRRNSADPFGVWAAETVVTTSQWANSTNPDVAFQHDVGALALKQVGGQEIADVVGARGIRFNQSPDQLYDSYGYPAEPPFDGEKLWVCDSDPGILLGSGSLAFMGIGCDMTGGSSGGGWIVDDEFVQSVNSFGIEGDPQYEEVMFGPQMRDAALEVYELAAEEDSVPPKLTRVSDGPDPFTPTGKRKRRTTLKFKLDETAFVVLTIKNGKGHVVHRIPKSKLLPDYYRTKWDGRHHKTNRVVKAGSYTYKLTATDLAGNSASKSGKVRVKR
jgi:V8-like Glu-specific endopeptidase